jgi:hypothetical protein
LHFLSRPRRTPRAGEWTPAKAVTFIVTLAATRSVTLAARAAEMSRKSVYALKRRDPAFASAWSAALAAAASPLRQGNASDTSDRPGFRPAHGNRRPAQPGNELAFDLLLAALRDSGSLAPSARRQ